MDEFGLLFTRLAPDIRPFFISGIRFRLPDIRLAGYPARKNCFKLKAEDK